MITMCTWNLQHLSPPSRGDHKTYTLAYRNQQRHRARNEITIEALKYILKYTGVDILVLQEVNSLDEKLVNCIQSTVYSLGYWFHYGPQMGTGSTMYTGTKISSQSEFYPIIFKRNIFCSKGELLHPPKTNVESFHAMSLRPSRKSELTEREWVFHRPLVLYDIYMNVNNRLMQGRYNFLLAVIHTSPGREDVTSPAAVTMVRRKAIGQKKWIIAGDWYLQPDEKVSIQQGKMTWDKALEVLHATRLAPNEKTNFSHNTGKSGMGGSKVADYFVCHEDIGGKASVVPAPSKLQKGANLLSLHNKNSTEVGREWFDSGLSDHIPVFAALFW